MSNTSLHNWLKQKRFTLLLFVLFSFLLTPLYATLFNQSLQLVISINYSLLILAGINMARKKRLIFAALLLGAVNIFLIWLEFALSWSDAIHILRISFALLIFSLISYVLIRDFSRLAETTVHTILGGLCGFVMIGIIGGIMYELLYFCEPDSFLLKPNQSVYALYYFSFISITTVGYGDVIPNSESAQSLTVLLNIIGYFYMTIVVATIIGKYLKRTQ